MEEDRDISFDLLPMEARDKWLDVARNFKSINEAKVVTEAEVEEWREYFHTKAIKSFRNCQKQLIKEAEEAIRNDED